jgi:hypothetical protein
MFKELAKLTRALAVLTLLFAAVTGSAQVNQGECIQSNQGPAYGLLGTQLYQAYMNCATNGPLFVSSVVQSGSGSGSSLAITNTKVLIEGQGTPTMANFNGTLFVFFGLPNNTNHYPIAWASTTDGSNFQINTTSQSAREPDFGAASFNGRLYVSWRDISGTGFNLGTFNPAIQQFDSIVHYNTPVATTPDLAVFNNQLYICFERTDFLTVEIDVSTDGVNFSQTGTIASSGISIVGEPRIAAVGAQLVVAWTENDLNPFRLTSFLSSSTNGSSFSTQQILPSNSTSQMGISPVLSSGFPFLGWPTFDTSSTGGIAFIETKCFFCATRRPL